MTPDKKCWQDHLISLFTDLFNGIRRSNPGPNDTPYFKKETLEVPPQTTRILTEELDEGQENLFLRGIGMSYHPCTNYKVLINGSPAYNNRDIIQGPNDFQDVWSPPLKVTKNVEISIINLNKGKTQLSEPLNESATEISVNSTKDYPDKGYLKVEDELIYYNSKNDNHFLECRRGEDGSQKAAHLKYKEVFREDNIIKYDLSIYGFIRSGKG